MNLGLSLSRLSTGLFLATIACGTGGAEERNFAGLLTNSPFGAAPVAAATTAETALEFRGYVYQGETPVFSIASTEAGGTHRSAWVSLGESGPAGYVVRSFDRANDTVQVDHRGQKLTLKLKQSRVQQVQAPPPGAQPAPANVEPGATGIDPAANPETKARLETIAAEIRRRRALRQQANQPNNPPPEPR